MTDTILVQRTPWHLWVLGVVNLLWTAMGSFDFVMTNTQDDAYLSGMGLNAAQIAIYNATPIWMTVGWAVGVFGGVIGAILLLMRKKLAAPVLAVSFVGAVASQMQMLTAEAREAFGATVWMSAGIIVWALLIAVYAWAMAKRGVLR